MELAWVAIVRLIVRLLPERFRYRAANMLYPFSGKLNQGVDITIGYLSDKYGLKYLVNTRDYIGWHIFFLGAYEKDTNEIMSRYIKEGMTVVEAGANHGSETVIIGKLIGEKGRLYAFEPLPILIERLSINIKINKQEDYVKIVPFALGELEQTIQFHIADEKLSNQGMGSKYLFSLATKTIFVEQTTLDKWAERTNLPAIDFIKMDIQGAELDLLRGGADTIKRWKPVIYLEADEVQTSNGHTTLEDIFSCLDGYGYEVLLTTLKGSRTLDRHNLESGNWLARPRSKDQLN